MSDYYARLLWPTYQLNRSAGCSHADIVAAVEAYFGGPVPEGSWGLLETWYHHRVKARWSYEKGNIRRAYNAMIGLRDYDYPARVRSRAGMVRLLEAIFHGYPPTGRQLSIKHKPSPVRVRWSWPAEQVARAQYARAWP